jgi:hypothetical protein
MSQGLQPPLSLCASARIALHVQSHGGKASNSQEGLDNAPPGPSRPLLTRPLAHLFAQQSTVLTCSSPRLLACYSLQLSVEAERTSTHVNSVPSSLTALRLLGVAAVVAGTSPVAAVMR